MSTGRLPNFITNRITHYTEKTNEKYKMKTNEKQEDLNVMFLFWSITKLVVVVLN